MNRALEQKAIQVERLAKDFAREKPRGRPREVASDVGQKRTRTQPGADKEIRKWSAPFSDRCLARRS